MVILNVPVDHIIRLSARITRNSDRVHYGSKVNADLEWKKSKQNM